MSMQLQPKIASVGMILLFLSIMESGLCQNRFSCSRPPKEKMVLIKGGNYIPFSKEAGKKKVAHIVSFCIDSHPVTNSEFLQFVSANPEWRRSRAKPIFADRNYLKNWAGDLKLGVNVIPSKPVTYVSWFAAQAYCRWVGKRLLTTYEWEYAFKKTTTKSTLLNKSAIPIRREWTEDFDNILLENNQTEDGNSPSILSCGGSSVNVNDPEDYQAFLRYSFRSSLKASYCLSNLGFRCAESIQKNLEIDK